MPDLSFDLLTYPLTNTINVAEVLWVLSNGLGLVVTMTSFLLARADRIRAARSGQNGGLAILSDAAQTAEWYRFLFHIGNFATGVVAGMTPDPQRQSLNTATAIISLWIILSSWMMTFSSWARLRARYDYRAYVLHHRRPSFPGIVSGSVIELHDARMVLMPWIWRDDERHPKDNRQS
jgi:hypothetical protein